MARFFRFSVFQVGDLQNLKSFFEISLFTLDGQEAATGRVRKTFLYLLTSPGL